MTAPYPPIEFPSPEDLARAGAVDPLTNLAAIRDYLSNEKQMSNMPVMVNPYAGPLFEGANIAAANLLTYFASQSGSGGVPNLLSQIINLPETGDIALNQRLSELKKEAQRRLDEWKKTLTSPAATTAGRPQGSAPTDEEIFPTTKTKNPIFVDPSQARLDPMLEGEYNTDPDVRDVEAQVAAAEAVGEEGAPPVDPSVGGVFSGGPPPGEILNGNWIFIGWETNYAGGYMVQQPVYEHFQSAGNSLITVFPTGDALSQWQEMLGLAPTGMLNPETVNAWGDVVKLAQMYAAGGATIPLRDIAMAYAADVAAGSTGSGGGSGGGGGAGIDWTTSEAILSSVMQETLGRDPSNEETDAFHGALTSAYNTSDGQLDLLQYGKDYVENNMSAGFYVGKARDYYTAMMAVLGA